MVHLLLLVLITMYPHWNSCISKEAVQASGMEVCWGGAGKAACWVPGTGSNLQVWDSRAW